MKRIVTILLCAGLLISFASCAKDKPEPTTQTTAQTTAATTTAAATTATTAKEEEKEVNTDYLYSGYWYKNEENKVVVFQFKADGTLSTSTYRRKNIASGDNTPDSTSRGSFKNNHDGTLSVYPDSEEPEVFDTYLVSAKQDLVCRNDDPEGATTISLQHFDSLSKDNAASVLFGDN